MVNNEFHSKNPRLISYWNMMAKKFEDVGHFGKATAYYEAAIDLCTEIFGKNHSQTLVLQRRLEALEAKRYSIAI